MKTLELTKEELDLILERRKNYDVEKVKAEENISEGIQLEIQKCRKYIGNSIQGARREFSYKRNLVKELNKIAGTEMFTLQTSFGSRQETVKRYYCTDENGIRSAVTYKYNWKKDHEKYGPEVIEWERTYKVLQSNIVHKEFPVVSIQPEDKDKRGRRRFSIQGFGYEVEKILCIRLETLVQKVSDLVQVNYNHLLERVFRLEAQSQFKEYLESNYSSFKKTVSSNHSTFFLDNGINVEIKLVVEYSTKTWKPIINYIRLPEVEKTEMPLELSILQDCALWRPLEI